MGNYTLNFTILGELPDLNKIIAAAKKHHMVYSKLKADATNICRLSCLRLPRINFKMHLHIIYHCKNKRKDKDNIAVAKKFILDGLIEAGKIRNDGWKEVEGWTEEFRVDKNNPRIEVIINDVIKTDEMDS